MNVIALVRCSSVDSGKKRISETLDKYHCALISPLIYHISSLIVSSDVSKIRILPADLAADHLGLVKDVWDNLCSSVDMIIHVGTLTPSSHFFSDS